MLYEVITVNDAAFHFRTNRYLSNTTGTFDDVALFNVTNVTEDGA